VSKLHTNLNLKTQNKTSTTPPITRITHKTFPSSFPATFWLEFEPPGISPVPVELDPVLAPEVAAAEEDEDEDEYEELLDMGELVGLVLEEDVV